MVLSSNIMYTTTQILRDGITAKYDNLLNVDSTPSVSELLGTYSCIVQDSLRHRSEPASLQVNGRHCLYN